MEGKDANTGIKDDASDSVPKPLSKRRRDDTSIMPIEFCRRRLENHSENKIETGTLRTTKCIINKRSFIRTGCYYGAAFYF